MDLHDELIPQQRRRLGAIRLPASISRHLPAVKEGHPEIRDDNVENFALVVTGVWDSTLGHASGITFVPRGL
jgi:hypothetical protein